MPNLKNNKREIAVRDRYLNQGYECLTKGYPDFCFVRGNEVIFVEVKRKLKYPTSKMGLSKQQRRMIDILKQLGLEVRVEYVD